MMHYSCYPLAMANHTPNTSGLTPGGTSLSGDGKSPRIVVSLPADAKDRLDGLARAAGMGTAKYVRRILLDHLTDTE